MKRATRFCGTDGDGGTTGAGTDATGAGGIVHFAEGKTLGAGVSPMGGLLGTREIMGTGTSSDAVSTGIVRVGMESVPIFPQPLGVAGERRPGGKAVTGPTTLVATEIVSVGVASADAFPAAHTRFRQFGQFTYPPANLLGTCSSFLQRGQSILMDIYIDNPKYR
jgi:hypothetical protein